MRDNRKELFSFSQSMILQCVLLFIGICLGLWVDVLCLFAVAGGTIITALVGKIESAYYHLLFCLPFTMIYKLSPSSTSLFVYAMLAVGLILMVRVRCFGSVQLFLITLFAIYISLGMGDNITTALKMIVEIILFYIFVKKIDSSDFKNQIMAFSLGVVSSSCIGLLKGNWSRIDRFYSDMNRIYINGVPSYRFSGLYLDPNYYSISLIFAITLCLILFWGKDGNRVLLGILVGALSIFGAMSFSKMFLLSIVLVAVTFAFCILKSPKRILTAILLVLVAGGFGYKWLESSGYFSMMMQRIFSGDISTGRFDIWKDYIAYIVSSPITLLFGDGLGAPYRTSGGPHNTYIETIFFIGLVGGMLLLAVLFSIFRYKRINNNRNVINYMLPLLFCIMIGTLGCLTINDLMFYCILMWIAMNYQVKFGTSQRLQAT